MKLFILSFVLLTSSAFAQWSTHFNTRLGTKLGIYGIECKGGELTTSNREDECSKGQWLVTVDTVNSCSKDGRICTEALAPSFVAELVRMRVMSIPEVAFYEIVAVSPVSSETKKILKKYILRDDMNGSAEIIRK